MKLSGSEKIVCYAELCNAIKVHIGQCHYSQQCCLAVYRSYSSRADSEEHRDCVSSEFGLTQAQTLMFGRVKLLAHCAILSLQALEWASRVAAGFEVAKANS
ncbi:TPA: hypothetical protein ACH3X2_008962 [Trebouxia sp. C0005]